MPQTFPTKPSANYKKKQSFKHVVHMLRVAFDDTSKFSTMLREQVCQNPAGTLPRQDEVPRVCGACRPHHQLIASNASRNSAAVPSGDDMFVRSPHQSSTLCWSGKAQWSVPLLSVSFWPPTLTELLNPAVRHQEVSFPSSDTYSFCRGCTSFCTFK